MVFTTLADAWKSNDPGAQRDNSGYSLGVNLSQYSQSPQQQAHATQLENPRETVFSPPPGYIQNPPPPQQSVQDTIDRLNYTIQHLSQQLDKSNQYITHLNQTVLTSGKCPLCGRKPTKTQQKSLQIKKDTVVSGLVVVFIIILFYVAITCMRTSKSRR